MPPANTHPSPLLWRCRYKIILNLKSRAVALCAPRVVAAKMGRCLTGICLPQNWAEHLRDGHGVLLLHVGEGQTSYSVFRFIKRVNNI